MKQYRIGDRTITSVGCGDVRLATAAARNVDAREVERAVLAALELGITLIDAADEEAAERLCGDAVRAQRLRDVAVVACRVPELAPRAGAPRRPRVTDRHGPASEPERDVLPERLPPAYVQQRIEASLRATRLDALPLAQLPLRTAWRASAAWPELVGACERLVREGKVLAWGAICDCGGDEAADAAELAREPWLASLSIPYSLCERGAEAVIAVASGTSASASADASAAEPARSESSDEASSGAAAPNAARPGGGGLVVLGDAELALLGGGADLDLLVKASAELGLLGGLTGSGAGAGASAGTGANAERAGNDAAPAPSGPKAILARRPLAGGALAGTLGPGVRLAMHDDRGSLDAAALERIAVLAARLAPLVKREPPAARSCEAALTALEHGRRPPDVEATTLAELALRFVLDRGAVALPRLHRAEHVAEAVAAAAAPPLSQALLERLADLSA